MKLTSVLRRACAPRVPSLARSRLASGRPIAVAAALTIACSAGAPAPSGPVTRGQGVVDASIVHELELASPSAAISNPAIAFGDGRYLVTWEERACSAGACTGLPRVAAAPVELAVDGVTVGPTTYLGAAGVAQQHPAVTFDGTSFLVVWTEGASLHGRRRTATGGDVLVRGQPEPAVLLHAGTAALGRPAVAASTAAPEYAVAVQQGTDLLALRVNTGNTGLRMSNGPQTVATLLSGEARPAVASDGASYLLAWSAGAGGLRAARIQNTRTNGFPAPGAALALTAAAVARPSAVWNGQGYLVSWADPLAQTTRATIVNPTATSAGTPFDLSPPGQGGEAAAAVAASAALPRPALVVYRSGSPAPALFGAALDGAVVQDGAAFWIEADRPADALALDAASNLALLSTVTADATGRTSVLGRISPAAGVQVGITGSGAGSGTVSSPPVFEHTFCPGCTAFHDHRVAEGTRLVVTAAPSGSDVFVGFTGSCSGMACDVVALRDVPIVVDAQFEPSGPPSLALTVVVGGEASGAVTSADGLLSCGATCEASYALGSTVALTAAPDGGASVVWSFDGAGCAAEGLVATCTVDAPVTVHADFYPPVPTTGRLGVSRTGAAGAVSSAPAAIDCGTTCSAELEGGTVLDLLAAPGPFSVFAGWSGACTGLDPTCRVTIEAGVETLVTAAFAELTGTVTVSVLGEGTVTSDPAGLQCEPACSATFGASAEPLSLSAVPRDPATWRFVGWGGDCSGTAPTCALSRGADHAVTATFEPIPITYHRLLVGTAGTGSGTVTASPPGTACGEGCADHVEGTTVTLTAQPAADSTFAGWGLTCAGTGPCAVTLTAPLTVVAQFDRIPPQVVQLTVTKTGTGLGTVTSSPAGVSCGSTCSASYEVGTQVTLTATPLGDARFAGWAGACAGTGACTVELQGATAVEARFDAPATYPLTVSLAGSGAGSVRGGPIDCGHPADQGATACSANPARGDVILLTAAAAEGSIFGGWTGGPCSGTATTCSVTADRAWLVSASFLSTAPEPGPTVRVRIFGSAYGRVTGGGIDCVPTGTGCSVTIARDQPVTLTAHESELGRFVGWTSGCTRDPAFPLSCTLTPTENVVVIATFYTPQPPPPTAWPVTVKVFGRGHVGGAGVDCLDGTGTCLTSVPVGQGLALEATPAPGHTLREWRGCSARPDAPTSCTVSPQASTAVVAVFDPPAPPPPPAEHPVHVRLFGGAGSVTSEAGFDCRPFAGTCLVRARPGPILLEAHEGANPFLRFQGCLPALDPATCTLNVSRATVVAAFFAWPPLPPEPDFHYVHLRTFGLVGAVTADATPCTNPMGACRVTVPRDGTVTFRATPPPGAVLGGWAGCQPVSGEPLACVATADRDKVVTVTFVAGP